MKELTTEIIINASQETVWRVLTDFARYTHWNPFITASEGQAVVGTRLVNRLQQGEKVFTFKPKVTQVEEGAYLEWLGHLWVPGLFDGRHYFRVEALTATTTKLTQGEHFSGLLRSIIMKSIAEKTHAGFIEMNRALKEQAERASNVVSS